MGHELWIEDDGILRLRFTGVVDEDDARALIDFVSPYLPNTSPENPLKILVFTGQEQFYTPQARRQFVELSRIYTYGYIALIGTKRIPRVMATLILRVTGRSDVHFFDEENEAYKWLANA